MNRSSKNFLISFVFLLSLVVMAGASGCATRGGVGANPWSSTKKVKLIEDVVYYKGKGHDPNKHILDIYIPKGKKNFPVVFFVHGGAWFAGDKAVTSNFGIALGSLGIGVVNVNYRLFPNVKYPTFIKDVARAFDWTVENIHKYGGDPDSIFVAGHSAGAHLAALLATNEKYLKDHRKSQDDIRGVIAISGVYNIHKGIVPKIFPANVRADASPTRNVDRRTPPFLLFYADNDMKELDEQAYAMDKALAKYNVYGKVVEVPDRNHNSVLGRIGPSNEKATREILSFLRKYK